MLERHIEAIIFCSSEPVKIEDIQSTLSEMFDSTVPMEDIETGITSLSEKYSNNDYSFEIAHIGGGYQFLTKPAFQVSIGIYLKQKSKKKLSTSALETLAIIAYKQPITKSEAESIRGVSCDYSIQKLLDKELIEIKGKSDAIGRPMLYGTTDKFMEYFGINSIDDLPLPKDFASDANEIGQLNDEEEVFENSTDNLMLNEEKSQEEPTKED